MSWPMERLMWCVLISCLLLMAGLHAVKAASFNPEPAAQIHTALVCDRNGCVER